MESLQYMKGVRTTGKNKNYNATESENIVQELYDFLKAHKRTQELLTTLETNTDELIQLHDKKNKKKKEWQHEIFNEAEKRFDAIILDNPDVYQGIMKIYRNHQVDIPSQHSVDKNEVISAKKKLIIEKYFEGLKNAG